MTRVKVCGITAAADRDAAVAAGADALGFTVDVAVDTPRAIAPERAASLVAGVPPFVTTVLVTMPAAVGDAIDLADRLGVDAVQLHGEYPRDALEELADTGHRLIVAVDAAATETAHDYADVADALLVDSTRDGGAGGTGRTADWAAARRLTAALEVPIILAGGLTPDNVAEAIRAVDPFAVDVASGVERRGGRKDHDAVEAFVETAARPAEVPR